MIFTIVKTLQSPEVSVQCPQKILSTNPRGSLSEKVEEEEPRGTN